MSTPRKSKFQLRKLLLIANYTISIFAISYGAELAVGYPMILLIGFAAFRTPLFSAIYSGLTYALAISILIFIPYLAIKLSRKYPKLNFLQKIFNPWRTNRKELGLEDSRCRFFTLPSWHRSRPGLRCSCYFCSSFRRNPLSRLALWSSQKHYRKETCHNFNFNYFWHRSRPVECRH